ncbi:MAG: GAF domain-containing protein [Rubrivivax sp.]|nr:GAF domain-containing protein [Rubrivivax sp.]
MFDKPRILALAKRYMDGQTDTEGFFKELTRTLVDETGATRASIWVYPDPMFRDSIQCLSLYDRTDATWSAGAVLSEEDFGPYFEAMRQDNLIVASDARAHPVTSCFNEVYFGPLGICSLLDMGIVVSGEPYGLFCCENTTDILQWTPQHVEYLRQVGTLLGFALRKARAGQAVAA